MVRTRISLVALLASAVLSSAAAAAPRDELLRLVPDDVAFCLTVQDLRGHAEALAASPFAEAFRKSAFGAALKESDELKKLRLFDAELQRQVGLGTAGIADKLLGDAFVLAYRGNPPGKMHEDQGLFLLRARDAQMLTDFVARLTRAQKESGELQELDERRHAGATYFRRAERKGENFYYINGPVLAFTAQERLLREVIERDRRASAGEPAIVQQLRALGVDRMLASVWINPRAFDAEMERNCEKAEGADKIVQATVRRYWKALDSAALALSLEKDARLMLAVRARTAELPPAAQRFLAEAARLPRLWDHFPEDALLAVAGRVDVAALLEMLGDFQTAEARASLSESLERGLGGPSGKDYLRELLPAIGPDVGLCLLAPPSSEKCPLPQAILAMRVHSEGGADEALLATVDFYARLAVLLQHGPGKSLSLKSIRQGKTEVKYLAGEGVFPSGVQPAYALKEGYLVFASSPEALGRFVAKGTAHEAGARPLLRISARALHHYLKERLDALAPLVAEQNKMPKEEAARRLETLRNVTELLDRIEIGQATQSGTLTFTMKLRPASPLK
jgi:transcriptional regulator of met regulon